MHMKFSSGKNAICFIMRVMIASLHRTIWITLLYAILLSVKSLKSEKQELLSLKADLGYIEQKDCMQSLTVTLKKHKI